MTKGKHFDGMFNPYKKVAFINAFVNAQVTTEFLSLGVDGILKDQIGKQSL